MVSKSEPFISSSISTITGPIRSVPLNIPSPNSMSYRGAVRIIGGILKEKERTSAFGGNTNMEIFTTHQALKDLLDVKNYSYSYILVTVGGIGIVNVMMLTVTERIKEIGVMKAVGATRGNIQTLFMLESGLLGFVSGLIGITIGAGISTLISTLGDFPIAVTWTSLASRLNLFWQNIDDFLDIPDDDISFLAKERRTFPCLLYRKHPQVCGTECKDIINPITHHYHLIVIML